MRKKTLILSALVCVLGGGALLSPGSASARTSVEYEPCIDYRDGPCSYENRIMLCDAGGYVHGLVCTDGTWTWL